MFTMSLGSPSPVVGRSPLRYPGGKAKLTKYILRHLPLVQGDTLLSPFAGGLHVEIAVASLGHRVFAYDAFQPLVDFWQVALSEHDKEALVAEVEKLRTNFDREQFYKLQTRLRASCNARINRNKIEVATAYFAVNRSSFSGSTLSGGCSRAAIEKRFTASSVERLRTLRASNVTVELADFRMALAKMNDTVAYCDPPYWEIGGLYGSAGDLSFTKQDHLDLAIILRERKGSWALSYNDCIEVRELYSDFRIVELPASKSMSNGRPCGELLILHSG